MKIRRGLQLVSALLISLSSLLTVSIPLAHAATSDCTWTDASGTNDNFDNASNWSCTGTTPGNGDVYNLTFDHTAAGFFPVDNIANLDVGTITFAGNFSGSVGYDITTTSNLNAINIAGGITDNSTAIDNEIDVNLVLTADQTFTGNGAGSQIDIGSGSEHLNIGSHALILSNALLLNPIAGSGSITVNDSHYPADGSGVSISAANPSFTGSVSVNQGALFLDSPADFSAASSITVANGTFLKGNGGVLPATTIQSGGTIAPGDSPGCLSGSDMTVTGTYAAELGGTTACSGYDQLQLTGAVTLSGSLQLSFVNGFTPTSGQSFTLISGSSGVSGTFSGLAEGATFTSGGVTFQITYQGGSGHDVVITAITPSSASGSGGAGSTPKSPNTGLAAVTTHPWLTLILTTLAALSITTIARRLKPAKG